jgi:hypothetical protein
MGNGFQNTFCYTNSLEYETCVDLEKDVSIGFITDLSSDGKDSREVNHMNQEEEEYCCIITAVTMNNTTFWDVTLCNPMKVHSRFSMHDVFSFLVIC